MPEKTVAKRVEIFMENMLFSARWLLAPFYFGLAISLFVLLIKFLMELLHLAHGAFTSSESDVILGGLTLVDLTLTGSLLIIVIFSGYENFVSRMDHSNHDDRPEWMGTTIFRRSSSRCCRRSWRFPPYSSFVSSCRSAPSRRSARKS